MVTAQVQNDMKRFVHSDLWDAGFHVMVTVNLYGYVKVEYSPDAKGVNSDEMAEMLAVLRNTTDIDNWKWHMESVGVNFLVVTIRSLDHLPS